MLRSTLGFSARVVNKRCVIIDLFYTHPGVTATEITALISIASRRKPHAQTIVTNSRIAKQVRGL